tara:strand:+ start:189 stop:605 length:417 start_codon:yes stop_codon:yes gene_type:complete
MATTCSISLTSDLLTDNLAVTDSTELMKAGSESDALDQMELCYIDIATGDQYDLFNADDSLNKNKANKIFISNDSTDETTYVIIEIKSEVIGRLYAGDWMFVPWGAEHADSDVEVTAVGGTARLTTAYFHQGHLKIAS